MDGGLGDRYPLSVRDLSLAFGAPVQLYAPYFCPNSSYFDDSSPYEKVSSNTSRQGCEDYAFEDVAPFMAKDFYGAARGRERALRCDVSPWESSEPDHVCVKRHAVAARDLEER